MKYLSFTFLAIVFFLTIPLSNSYSQYYGGYYPGYYSGSYYGGCLTGVGCSGAYKAATIIGLGFDTLNYGISTYQYHKAQEDQIRQIQYQGEAARSAVNYQKQMEDYKNMMLVAPFFEDSIPRTKAGSSSPKVAPLKSNRETR